MNSTETTSREWTRLRERLSLAAAASATFAETDAARRSDILRARALSLAEEPAQADDPLGYIEVVEFQLAYERHAIETRWIAEVWAMRELVKLPGAPSFVAGIIHARGRIVSVVDPKDLFQLPSQGLPDSNRVLILSGGGIEFGLLVDSVAGTRRVGRSTLQPALPTLVGQRRDFLLGIAPGPLIALDAEIILRDPRLSVHDS